MNRLVLRRFASSSRYGSLEKYGSLNRSAKYRVLYQKRVWENEGSFFVSGDEVTNTKLEEIMNLQAKDDWTLHKMTPVNGRNGDAGVTKGYLMVFKSGGSGCACK